MKKLAQAVLLLLYFCPLAAGGTAADPVNQEDSFLITEVWLGSKRISREAVVLYQNGQLFLPNDFLISVLHLPLTPNQAGGVSGWAYQQSNRVDLAPQDKTAAVGQQSYALQAPDSVNLNGEWYYNATFIAKVFDLSISFDYSRQAVYIESGQYPLPREEQQQNADRRKRFDRLKDIEQSENQTAQTPLFTDSSFIQAPFLDLAARYNINKPEVGPSQNFFGYSADAFAVTGGFDSEVYVYDMDNNSPATIALKTGRYDPDGKMLGLFKKFEAGDVFSFSSPVVNYSQSGRGFKFSTNQDDNAESKTFNIRQPLQLGWDVELYRDTELLGYQGSNNTGFFEFTDVPLLLGNNRFKLVFYGPQGQRREEEINYLFMGGVINKGQTSVQAGFIEKNKYLIETRKDVPSYSQGYNGLLSISHGLTDTLTANVSGIYDSVPILGEDGFIREDKFFASAGLAYLWRGMFFNAQSVFDPKEKGVSADMYWQTNWNGWDLTAQNIYYDGSVTERNALGATHINNDTVARVNKTITWGRLNLPINYAFRYFTTQSNQYQTEHTLGLYKTVFRNIYAATSYQHITGLNGADINLITLDLNQTSNGYSIRGSASYDFIYNHIRQVGINTYKDITERLNFGLSFNRTSLSDLTSDYSNNYGGSLNWKTKYGYWSVDAGWSDRKAYYAYLGFNMSFLFDKFTNRMHSSPDKLYGCGAISADVFMDNNQNGRHDTWEESLPGAALTLTPSVQEKEQTLADENGEVFITKVRGYQPYTAEVNVNKLEDSFALISPSGPQRVQVRPGQIVRLNYPILGTGDIEGTVYLKTPAAPKEALRGIVLKLYNVKTGKLVSSRVSEFDGYFLFESLPLGTYRLEVDGGQRTSLGLNTPKPIVFVIDKNEQLKRTNMEVSYSAPSGRTETDITTSSLALAPLRGQNQAKVVFRKKGEAV